MIDQIIRVAVIADLVVNLILHSIAVQKYCSQEIQINKAVKTFTKMENQLNRVDRYTQTLYEESIATHRFRLSDGYEVVEGTETSNTIPKQK
jgi:hypothetical protein